MLTDNPQPLNRAKGSVAITVVTPSALMGGSWNSSYSLFSTFSELLPLSSNSTQWAQKQVRPVLGDNSLSHLVPRLRLISQACACTCTHTHTHTHTHTFFFFTSPGMFFSEPTAGATGGKRRRSAGGSLNKWLLLPWCRVIGPCLSVEMGWQQELMSCRHGDGQLTSNFNHLWVNGKRGKEMLRHLERHGGSGSFREP